MKYSSVISDDVKEILEEILDHFEFEKYEKLGLQCQYCLWVPDRDWDPVHDCVLTRSYALLDKSIVFQR